MTTPSSLVIEREMPHPPEKIWRALTQSQLIQQWLMDNNFEPTVGHAFQFRSTPMPQWDGIIQSKVLVVEPNHKLSYTWASMGIEMTVVWTLVATPTGTLLRMEQSGFPPEGDHYYKGAQYGWQNFLGKLQQLLAELD